MSVNDIHLPAQPAEGPNHSRDEAQRKEGAAIRGEDAPMYEDSLVFLFVDWITRHGAGNHVHDMAAPHQFERLGTRLALGPAGERMKITDDEADPQRLPRRVGHVASGPRPRVRDRARARS